MAHVNTIGSSPAVPAGGVLHGIGAFFGGIWEGYLAYCRYQQLSALDDGELAARGIRRADIPRTAMSLPVDRAA